jgi:hypothetical protein
MLANEGAIRRVGVRAIEHERVLGEPSIAGEVGHSRIRAVARSVSVTTRNVGPGARLCIRRAAGARSIAGVRNQGGTATHSPPPWRGGAQSRDECAPPLLPPPPEEGLSPRRWRPPPLVPRPVEPPSLRPARWRPPPQSRKNSAAPPKSPPVSRNRSELRLARGNGVSLVRGSRVPPTPPGFGEREGLGTRREGGFVSAAAARARRREPRARPKREVLAGASAGGARTPAEASARTIGCAPASCQSRTATWIRILDRERR